MPGVVESGTADRNKKRGGSREFEAGMESESEELIA